MVVPIHGGCPSHRAVGQVLVVKISRVSRGWWFSWPTGLQGFSVGISDWSSTNNEVQTYSTKSKFKSKVWDYGICSVYYIYVYMNRSNPPDWSVHPSVHLATRASLSRTFRDEHYEFTFQACDCMTLLGLGLWDIRFFERSHTGEIWRLVCAFCVLLGRSLQHRNILHTAPFFSG